MRRLKMTLSKLALCSLALVLGATLGACVAPSQEAQATQQTQQAQMQQPVAQPAPAPAPAPVPAKQEAPKKQEEPVDIYQVKVEPLTVADCARCHVVQYGSLKDEGGRHKFDCQNCHEQFHAYNPTLNNWDDLMPNCSNCHTLPHGEKHSTCSACHWNPHAPTNIPYTKVITGACASCHSSPAQQIKQYPSAHTEVGCTSCHHDRHGYVPTCFECHEPHYEGQGLEACAECHPVHKPLQMTFTPETGAKTCDACHSQVYSEWTQTPSKHGQVNCTVCHTQHGLIPACADCHGQPHSQNLLSKFPNCLTCHLNPHDLPVKKK